MAAFYNIEINAYTIILLLIIKFAIRRVFLNLSADKLCFHYVLNLNIIYCISDILASLLMGTNLPWARAGLQILNMIYIETLTLISYIWVSYVFHRINKPLSLRRKMILMIPLFVVTVMLLMNPMTEFIFQITENNVYVRKSGLYAHWAVGWFYIIFGAMVAVKAIWEAPNKVQKRKIIPLVYFVMCPAVASVFQMIFNGLSTTHIGLAVGIVLIFTVTIGQEVSTDTLTGLNNRGSLDNFILNHVDNIHEQNVTAFMMDLNDFKDINDKYGHATGDAALKAAADVLKKACVVIEERMFLCRYGGDEFIILGRDFKEETRVKLVQAIRALAEQKNAENQMKYCIEFSIGVAEGVCRGYDDFEKLIDRADEAMYINKNEMKMNRTMQK